MRQRLGFAPRPRHRQTRAWVTLWPVLFLFLMIGCHQEKTVMDRADVPTSAPASTPTPTPAAPQPSPAAELDKALEQLPPAVRQQMRGLGYGLSNKPAPVKPAPSPTVPQRPVSP